MRLPVLLASLVCFLALSSATVVQAVPYLIFSSGASDIDTYHVNDAGGTPIAISSLTSTTPGRMTLRADGELFVSNRQANMVSRYLNVDGVLSANPTNPTIVSAANIDNANGMAFRDDELFINSFDDSRIVRYTFNGSGAAVAEPSSSYITTTPEIDGTRERGVAFSSTGDRMYVTGCCSPSNSDGVVAIYSLDGAGTATLQNTITPSDLNGFGLALGNAQSIAVSSTGDLWVGDAGSSVDSSLADIARLTVDYNTGTLTAAEVVIPGSDTNLARPVNIAFDPNGDLLVANLGLTGSNGDGFLSRFTLDGSGDVLSSLKFGFGDNYNGIIALELPVPPVPEPSSLLLLSFGAFALLRRARRPRQTEV